MRQRLSCLILIFLLVGVHTQSIASTSSIQKPAKHGLFSEELISADELKTLMTGRKKILILDARGQQSYNQAHIKGAVLALTPSYYEQEELFRQAILAKAPDREKALTEHMALFPKDSKIVTYCNDDCQASAVLLLQLKKLGFSDVRALDEGFQTWMNVKRYPVTVLQEIPHTQPHQ